MPDQQVQNLALVFVDIPTIGAIRERMGEAVARDCQQRSLALLGDVRKQYAGTLVRSIGGTLLCSFANAADAVSAGIAMHRAIVSGGLAEEGVLIRMGMHCGTVQIRGGNYSGEVVTSAARMVTLAKAGCIVATASIREQAGNNLAAAFVPLEGEAAARLNMELFEVKWKSSDTDVELLVDEPPPAEVRQRRKTRPKNLRPTDRAKPVPLKEIDLREIKPEDETSKVSDETETTEKESVPKKKRGTLPPDAKLCLIWREKVLVIDADNRVDMGREDACDIVLQVHTASRRHAEVFFRDGCFILSDASANGTFIYDEKGKEYFVHKGEAILGEMGAICPGCPQEEPGCEVLLYWMAE